METLLILHAGALGALLAGLHAQRTGKLPFYIGVLCAVLLPYLLGYNAAQVAFTHNELEQFGAIGPVVILLFYGGCVGFIAAHIANIVLGGDIERPQSSHHIVQHAI